MVEWLALRAGSRLLLMPKAEAMELAPKQSAEADDPLASRSEGFLFVTEIALVKLRSGGLGLRQRDDRRAPFARRSPWGLGLAATANSAHRPVRRSQ